MITDVELEEIVVRAKNFDPRDGDPRCAEDALALVDEVRRLRERFGVHVFEARTGGMVYRHAEMPEGQALLLSPRKTMPDGSLEPQEEWAKRCASMVGLKP